MKYWIIGANGQVGSALIRSLKDNKRNFIGTTRKDVDITDYEQVLTFVAANEFDVIINASAYTAVDKAETDELNAYATNAEAVKNLAQVALKLDVPLLHISTDYVFDGQKQGAYSEQDPVCPINVYGSSKLKGEEYLEVSGAKYINLRTSWVFGLEGGNFVKTMIRLSNEKDQLGIIDDQIGAPTFAGDIARTLLLIAEKTASDGFKDWGTYHYSGAPTVSWWGFAKYAIEDAHKHGIIGTLPRLNKITTDNYPTPAKRPMNSRLDNHKIQKVFSVGFSDWREGVKVLNKTLAVDAEAV